MPVPGIVMVIAVLIFLVMLLGMLYALGAVADIGATFDVIAGVIVIGWEACCTGIADGTIIVITVITITKRDALAIFPY